MTSEHNEIIINDRKIAEYARKQASLHHEEADILTAIANLIDRNCEIRETLQPKSTSEVSPFAFLEDAVKQSQLSIEKSAINLGNSFQLITEHFSNSTVDHITNDRDDSFVRDVFSKLNIEIEKVIKPNVDSKPRAIYSTKCGHTILFRKTTYNPDWPINSMFITAIEEDLFLFNQTKYALIARYEKGNTVGYKDWAIYDIDNLSLTLQGDKIHLIGDYIKTPYIEIDMIFGEVGKLPYIIFKMEGILVPILAG